MSSNGLTFTTVAYSGTTTATSAQDGGLAINAGGKPNGMCYDKIHDILYTTSSNDAAVRAISASGYITTVAGVIGHNEDTGLGGPATSAHISGPTGCTVDTTGNLYVIQQDQTVIRVVDQATKTWTHFAGTYNTPGYTGDGSAAISAKISNPQNAWADSTHYVYVADQLDKQSNIRRIDTSTGTITTYAGGFSSASNSVFSGGGVPAGLANIPNYPVVSGDASGNVVIGSFGIVMMVDSAGYIFQIAGTEIPGSDSTADDDVAYGSPGATSGNAADALFGRVTSVTLDGSKFYVMDYNQKT
eukprot:gene39003-48166_t